MTAWILTLMMFLAPPARLAALPSFPGWAETEAEKTARYTSIAADIAEVVEEVHPKAPARLASLLVSLAFVEGGFARDVDIGPCYRPLPSSPRCDGGAAVSLWQIRLGDGATKEGWRKADLQSDRKKAIRTAYRMIRRSFAACSKAGPDAGLRAYASGDCRHGQEASAARIGLARRLVERFPFPVNKTSPAVNDPPGSVNARALSVNAPRLGAVVGAQLLPLR